MCSFFAYLELKFNKTLNHLDDEIRDTTSFKKDKKKFDTKSKRHNNFKGAKKYDIRYIDEGQIFKAFYKNILSFSS